MLMRSRRQFQVRAVTAGTTRLTVLLPNDHFRTLDVVILGVNNFARANHYEQLGWPTQTIFAEYGPAFTKNDGSLGYAKPISMKGYLMQVNIVKSQSDHEFAIRQQTKLIGAEMRLFKQWLNTRDHPQRTDWPQQVNHLSHALNEFGNHNLTFGELLKQFTNTFYQGSPHQKQRTESLAKKAREIRDQIDATRDARLPIAYMLINVQNVTHFLYGDDRDIQFNTDQADAEHRKAGDLQRFMFTRVPQQKAEFEKLGIPFYDPKRLANWRTTNQAVWDPKQLDAFHLGG
jgi:hypothetical protein